MASHDETESFIWNGQRMYLKVGQVLTGRKKLSKNTGVPETTIERVLEYLETEQQIRQQKTTKYRVITILKWETYQKTDNKRTTDGQQTDTYKKLRSKEVKKNTIHTATQSVADDEVEIIPEPGENNGKRGKKADPSKYNPLGAEIIKAFADKVNPSCVRYYRVTSQREACDQLIETYGLEKVLKAVDLLKKTNTQPYFPTIMTPLQLYQKYEALRNAFARASREKKGKEIIM